MAHDKNAWKACNRHKRFPSSNLGHSAKNRLPGKVLPPPKIKGKGWQAKPGGSAKTAKKPQRMRKVRVSLYYRPSLDRNGTAPLLIAVNHASSSCYLPIIGVRLSPGQWDKVKKKVVNHPKADTINSVALTTLGKATEAVMRLGSVRGLSTAQVRDLIADYVYPATGQDTGFVAVMRSYMERCDKPSTKDKFSQTITHVERWQGKRSARKLQFTDIDPEWLQSFDRYLVSYCPSPNSRSIHLRNIRTIFNYALANSLTTAPYPFRKYKIKQAPPNPTPLTLDQLRLLWNHHPGTELCAYWLDMWKLIFCLIGINMADFATLVKISQGRVNYTRQKTGRLYSVKVEPIALQLIKAHRGRRYLLDVLDRYRSVHVANSACNKALKAIAEELGLPRITTYTARYTWATLAQSLDIPIEVISQGLGHTYGMAVTLGYIMPDRRKVDEANKQVLALLFGNSKDK